ncbi:MAG TPA: FAD-binding oxidoreductase, partial [Actinobacteria bacterium]|nr:FAD-binding oxidoreductase [Actinomycetota bacterium]
MDHGLGTGALQATAPAQQRADTVEGPTQEKQVQTADIVVIGAGIIGSSIAYQLARRTPDRIVILDKGAGPSEGSTGASSAVIRTLYSQPNVVQLALGGQRAYRNWSDFTQLSEPSCRFEPTGALWMLNFTTIQAEHTADRLRSQGVRVSILDANGVRERFPALSTCGEPFDLTGVTPHECRDFEAALFEEDAGYANPTGANQDLLTAAKREGADVRFRSPVTGVRTGDGRVTGVTLADGTAIDAPLVVNAAGPWCNRLNEMAGVDIPWTLTPTRVQVVYRAMSDQVRRPIPVTVNGSIYLRPESHGQRILFGSVLAEDESERVDPDNYRTSVDAAFKDIKIHALHHRIPALPHKGAVTGIAGLYTVNEQDVHPILGPTELEGWFVANGFSGHGFKLAPMIGSMIAQEITGERAS